MQKLDDLPTSSPKIEITKADLVIASRLFWEKQARESQIPPKSEWLCWLILSGRGWGKTRTGAEWIAYQAITQPKTRWAVIGKTYADARDTCVEGDSGLLNVLNRYGMLKNWNRSIGELFLDNGSRIKLFSAEEPDRLRGPQHHGAWCDELAAWDKVDAWDQLQFGLRLGKFPQTVVTTTPRPVPLIKSLIKRDTTYITRGSTFENVKNLAASALLELQTRYAGTRLGRQELEGEVLEDVEGALWSRSMLESGRITKDELPPLIRIVVGLDPAVTSGENSDDTGIVAAGLSADGQFYVLEDATYHGTPEQWASRAVGVYKDWEADRIIAETNNGGDLVEMVLRNVDPNVPVKKVTASRGKRVRAEPISALYEQNRVHHVGSNFTQLEDEMCQWLPDSGHSPDRMDALVWALTELSESSASMLAFAAMARFCSVCRSPNIKSATVCSKCGNSLN